MTDPRALGGAWKRFQRHTRSIPAEDLAPFVERYWTAEWAYDEPYQQLIVPLPQVHVTVQDSGEVTLRGVSSRHVIRELSGAGGVIGAAFRPAGFRAFIDQPVSTLTDRTIPVIDTRLASDGPASPDIAGLEEWLRAAAPIADPTGEWVNAVVDAVAAEPTIARVDQLAARFGTSVRRLQRLFNQYVGVPPKWVIRRYRLREVTDRMEQGAYIDWAGLAIELGYADQAHLSRDFTSIFGEPPTHYAARYDQADKLN